MSWKLFQQPRRGPQNSRYPKIAVRPKGMCTLNPSAAEYMGLNGKDLAYFELFIDKERSMAGLKVVSGESPHTINARPRGMVRGESYRFSLRLALKQLGIKDESNSHIALIQKESDLFVFTLPQGSI
jgi:hypothetical protein